MSRISNICAPAYAAISTGGNACDTYSARTSGSVNYIPGYIVQFAEYGLCSRLFPRSSDGSHISSTSIGELVIASGTSIEGVTGSSLFSAALLSSSSPVPSSTDCLSCSCSAFLAFSFLRRFDTTFYSVSAHFPLFVFFRDSTGLYFSVSSSSPIPVPATLASGPVHCGGGYSAGAAFLVAAS